MNAMDNIERLKKQIESEQRKINSCNHSFKAAVYNPETVREPYGSHLVNQGSDVWCEPDGYRDVEKNRWTKTCINCGFSVHTYKTQPIVVGYEPKF